MNQRYIEVIRHAVTAVIAAAVGGVLVLAFVGSGKNELAQAVAERETLKLRVGTLQREVRRLEGEIEAPRKERAALASEVKRLRAALAEKEKAVAEAQSQRQAAGEQAVTVAEGLEASKARAAQLNQAYKKLLDEKRELAEVGAARLSELERTKKALEEAQAEVARLTGARGIYTVQDGDYLSKIAAFFYHDGLRWPDIFKANAFLVSDPDLIYPRMVLIIPQ